MDKIIARIRSERGMMARVASACGIHRAAVHQWTRVPLERVHAVAEVLEIEPEDIRPDFFRPRRR